ncbi:MAG: hypothetical protein ABFR50_06405 [Candidatus Fermentibacteria bacterium]
MKREIREGTIHVRGLWERQETSMSMISEDCANAGFFVRHHSFARSDIQENSWFSEYTDEQYDSPFDCLAYYRWHVIPEKLREASGLRDETDLELLLDNAGYSASLIAEELFCMIDACLESGNCSEEDLQRIRLAYNGLSGFQDDYVHRIAQWGSIADSGISMFSVNSPITSIS